ncbi:MAG: hypothetical protein K8H86_15535, partial [Ignavibacteriaceae bacterium]|nr:hypothetical protein [Ignavibacteriaceae bacterium]
MSSINHKKAYILGLLVGGGKIDKDVFVIDLPFKKWGMEPSRMNIIATDILTKICQCFNSTYKFNVTYEISSNKWLIKPMPDSNIEELKKDLDDLHLPTSGFLLAKADLTFAKIELKGISIESFLSGIFDARASLALSHRRFTNDAPVVSIEIPGSTKNFKFVVQLCSWLTDLGSTTDQILYNHPNQHAASDPNYCGWKKGFKIRFLVRSFLARHSFALQSKSIDITKIEESQKKDEQIPCNLRKLRKPSPVTIHTDQNSNDLPTEVRNKIFFHYHHFCAVIGCSHAPIEEIKKLVDHKESFISFYPRLSKGNKELLYNQIKMIKETDFPEMEINIQKSIVKNILKNEQLNDFLGIEQGIAYLFAAKLKGKRHTGNMKDIIDKCMDDEVDIISIGKNFESPLVFTNNSNNRAFI